MVAQSEILSPPGIIGFTNFEFPASTPELDPDGIFYEVMRWPDFQLMGGLLGEQVRRSGQKFDVVVSPLRGGVFPGTLVREALELPEVETIGLNHYQGVQARDEAARQELQVYKSITHPERIIRKRVLVVDDVNHTSTTLIGLRDLLLQQYNAASVATAVLHEKPAWRQIKADFVVRFTDSWIVYPWEHLGSPHHDRWEFFREKLPVWMIDEYGEIMSFPEALERALAVGFREDELPSLTDESFWGSLKANIGERYQQVFGHNTLDTNTWRILFPEHDEDWYANLAEARQTTGL